MSSSFKRSSDEVENSFSSSFHLSSEEVREYCDPCTIGKCIEKSALFFCQECKEFLCGDCREFHKKVSLTKTHIVSQIDGPKTASGQSGKVDELSEHLSNITVSGATAATHADHTGGAMKLFRKATLTNQINASLDDDQKPCELRGIAAVDNLVYVADYANGKIKLFDLAGQTIAQYIESRAFDITALGKDRIAFTSLRKYFTILSKTGNTLKHVKTVDTDVHARGICCDNGLIYVSLYGLNDSDRQAQVNIFTTDGALKRRMEPILNGRQVLQRPCYLSMNQHTGTIYVSDFNVGVIALSSTGKVKFIKQVFDTTETAQGISIDNQGQVYICGMNNDNVMTMSADGNDVYEILNRECVAAKTLTNVENQMFLCRHNTDLVSVFKLS